MTRIIPSGSIGGPLLFTSVANDGTLLNGETDGLAINFADATYFNTSTWQQSWTQVRTSSVDVRSSPHTFFTNSSTTPKVVKTSAGGLGWSPHNMQTRANELTHGDWSDASNITVTGSQADPAGGSTAFSFVENGVNSAHKLGNFGFPATIVTSVIHTFSIYVKNLSGTRHFGLYASDNSFSHSISANFDPITGVASGTTQGGSATLISTGSESIGNGWLRVWMTGIIPATTLNTYMQLFTSADVASYAGDSTSGVYVYGYQVNRGIVPTASIISSTAAKYGLPISYGEGLLVEPAATNLTLQSQAFGTSWSTAGTLSIGTNSTVAPDGSTTADTLVGGTSDAGQYVTQSITVSSATTYTASIYVKDSTGVQWFRVALWDASANGANYYYDLTSGVTGTTSTFGTGWTNSGSTITAVGNGWYRCTMTVVTNGTTLQWFIQKVTADNGSTNHTANVAVWGAQLETGSAATSYYPTTTASLTRSADGLFVLVSSFVYSQTVGTVYTKHTPYAGADATWAFSQAGSNFIELHAMQNLLIYDSTEQVNTNDGAVSSGVSTQIACAWAANNCAISKDGTSVTTDTSAAIPSGVSKLYLSSYEGTGTPNNLISKFVYVPRRLSDGSLPTWRYNF